MKPLIIANWKMNLMLNESISYAKTIASFQHSSQLLLAPSTIYLAHLGSLFPQLNFCAQDVSVFNPGAYTGEFAAALIKSCAVNYAIVGHSERRINFAEDNKIIKQKAENCINNNIIPIICIGESAEIRRNNNVQEFLLNQLNESIPSNANESNIIIAYEPIWAIGSGITPSGAEIQELFSFLKNNHNTRFVAKNVTMIYGGSVNSKNYKEILSVPDNKGLLVGSASLNEIELKTILN
jgi:triosephosphate isomerase